MYETIQKRLKNIKKRAAKHGWDYDLDNPWLGDKLAVGYCEATGAKLDLEGSPFRSPNSPSVDRVDSNKGYTKDNCQITTLIYNIAKGDQSEAILIDWAISFVEKYENEINMGKSVQHKDSSAAE